MSIENADSVMTVQETGPTLTRPKQIKTPEQLFGNDATVEEMRELTMMQYIKISLKVD